MKIVDWLFKNNSGKVVLAQQPNLPVIIAFILVIGSWIFTNNLGDFFRVGFYFALLWWSWLELAYGVNGFRRMLGLAVAGLSLYQLINQLW